MAQQSKEKNREYRREWRRKNNDRAKAQDKKDNKKKRDKKLRKLFTQLKYERAHPGRSKKYYEENKAKVLTRQKEQRRLKKLERVSSFVM